MSPHFFCEDALHESVIKKANEVISPRVKWAVTITGGKGNIVKKLPEYNRVPEHVQICALVDLNGGDECAPEHKKTLLDTLPSSPGGGFRLIIAVREAEAWLLADRENFAAYLGVAASLVPSYAEQIPDPKQCVINLAKKSKKRNIRESVVPRGTAKIGTAYNLALSQFVAEKWDIDKAAEASPSLNYFRCALRRYRRAAGDN